MPRNASLVFSPETYQELVGVLTPVRERIQPLLDSGDAAALAEFAVRGALNMFREAESVGFSGAEEVLALKHILLRIHAHNVTHEVSLTFDEFGQLAAQAFRQGGKVHNLLRSYQAA